MFRKNECEIVAQMLWEYAERSLDCADFDRVEEHLSACDPCRRDAETFQSTVSIVDAARAVPIPESQTTWMELRATLERENRSVTTSRSPIWKVSFGWRPGPAWSMALAGAFVGLVVFKMMSADDPGQLPAITKDGPSQYGGTGGPSLSNPATGPGPKAVAAAPQSSSGSDEVSAQDEIQSDNRAQSEIRNTVKPRLTMTGMTAAPATLNKSSTKISQAFDRGVLDGDRPAASKHNFVITPAAYPDNNGPERNYVIGSIISSRGSGGQASQQGGEESQVW